MENTMIDTNSTLAAEGDNLAVEVDLYDLNNYDVPDPGVLSEKNELDLMEPPQVLQLFTNSQRWRNMTLCSRARQLWLHLRAYLHDIVENEKRSELRVSRLTHGLEPLRRLEVAAGLCSVAQDLMGRRFVVLDGAGYLHQHTKDGWIMVKLQAPVALNGLVTMLGPLGEVGRFVGWGPAGVAILGPDFNLMWLSKPQVSKKLGQEPICCLPVPNLGLLLVAQVSGSLELWRFRSGGRRLVSCGLPLHPPPGLTGSLQRLTLGPTTNRHTPQHCFAAYGSAVLTFDLNSWALVDVCQDLHKTIISDLEYCEEVEAMVTASWDSTVKVWEADWQIRMVFVGHTGPVTAMTVLPNSTLVVSASQDGTLRTWDLQAAAQVGEVTLGNWSWNSPSRRVSRLLAPAGPGWPVLSLCSKSVELFGLRDLYTPLAQLSARVLHFQVAPALPAPTDPSLPSRLVCACADGSVYVVSAVTGCTVSSLMLEPEDCATSVAYCLSREALWLLTRSGHLVRVNAARSPMVVQHRLPSPAPPAPQPCCLHLYSHLIDARSAFTCWEIVRRNRGDLCRSTIAWAWKNKNRYLPMMGHTDGTLSVLDWRSSVTVFCTEAHSPGPVTAIASTWNSIVTSGGDLTVKMWRVFPYAEESLSLLHTFSGCHPVVMLCALDKRVTVGFEDPESATYGLVQFGLGDKMRYDHRPQDDPMDHITGLCCCPTLKLYACSSLDCTVRIWTWENHLLRLLQLDGPPQALAFSSNSGDLVLALGSRLCLVSHKLYLPTSYLVKKLCQKAPDVVYDPPLPLTSQKPLTSAQLQRLSSLHGADSLSAAMPFIHHHTATLQQPVLKEDLEDLMARDQDLQQLRLGLVVPKEWPPPSWKLRQEAFDNYLQLIYGPDLLDIKSGRESGQWGTGATNTEEESQDTWDQTKAATYIGQASVSMEAEPVPTRLAPQTPGAPGRHFACPPHVSLPIPPTHQNVHSRASQLLAHSSLSYDLGLSLDLQLQWDETAGKTMNLNTSSILKHRAPLLLQRQPTEPPSNLGGFFPDTIKSHMHCPRPISFPGHVPNSVVLQRMWFHAEPSGSQDDLWLKHRRFSTARWRRKLIHWLPREGEEKEEEEEEEEEEDLEHLEELEMDWISSPMISDEQLEVLEPDAGSSPDLTTKPSKSHEAPKTKTHIGSLHHRGHQLWGERNGRLPRLLHFFIVQNWFKKLFPIFTLEAYPEMGTVEGLALMFVDFLEQATWPDRVHILNALLRLLPDMSSNLCNQLKEKLLYLLNLDQPPSLQDQTQKQFVMLALQLLLACTLESRDVVLEIMSYFLYSPANCQKELKSLLNGLGLHDPEGFLFKEMMTWVQGANLGSKAMLRIQCQQKLDDMILQVWWANGWVAHRMGTCHLLHGSPKSLREEAQWCSQECPGFSPTRTSLAVSLYRRMLHGVGGCPDETPPGLGMDILEHSATSSSLEPLREVSSQASPIPGAPLCTMSISWTPRVSEVPFRVPEVTVSPVPSPVEFKASVLELQAPSTLVHMRTLRTKRALPESLMPFCTVPETYLHGHQATTLNIRPLPLEQTEWSHLQMLDLCHIDALNFFCEKQRVQQLGLIEDECLTLSPLSLSWRQMRPNTVIRPPRDHWLCPILRLQEAKTQSFGMVLRGKLSHRAPAREGSIRMLKLPLPRVELQPFPPGWPAPQRALPPLLLQPALQRYFLPQDSNPGTYN
ncbi:WD repeat-containing protein 97 [Nannospalax galili]|uniref:WD repeat-containing protein 97 n=1 Tax=Nannospalax galili TaxID=1026970 RepID=UPI00111BD95E|nr:WD repeat-containing protein 97 [Nannospalax galili]